MNRGNREKEREKGKEGREEWGQRDGEGEKAKESRGRERKMNTD